MPFDDGALLRLRTIFAERPAILLDTDKHRRAAVVAPLVWRNGEWQLLVLRRAASLSTHGGQVAFPGGTAETGEEFDETALRELEEEIGVRRDQVELIGRLDDLITISGFVVTPFVGIIDPSATLSLQASEVDETYEVPIEALMRRGNPEVRYVGYRNRDYPAYFYRHGDLEIWGLTGRMVKALLDLVVLTF